MSAMDVTSNVAETTNPATTIYVGNLDQRYNCAVRIEPMTHLRHYIE